MENIFSKEDFEDEDANIPKLTKAGKIPFGGNKYTGASDSKTAERFRRFRGILHGILPEKKPFHPNSTPGGIRGALDCDWRNRVLGAQNEIDDPHGWLIMHARGNVVIDIDKHGNHRLIDLDDSDAALTLHESDLEMLMAGKSNQI